MCVMCVSLSVFVCVIVMCGDFVMCVCGLYVFVFVLLCSFFVYV